LRKEANDGRPQPLLSGSRWIAGIINSCRAGVFDFFFELMKV